MYVKMQKKDYLLSVRIDIFKGPQNLIFAQWARRPLIDSLQIHTFFGAKINYILPVLKLKNLKKKYSILLVFDSH